MKPKTALLCFSGIVLAVIVGNLATDQLRIHVLPPKYEAKYAYFPDVDPGLSQETDGGWEYGGSIGIGDGKTVPILQRRIR